jgi:peptidylamidoglycolate lyase
MKVRDRPDGRSPEEGPWTAKTRAAAHLYDVEEFLMRVLGHVLAVSGLLGALGSTAGVAVGAEQKGGEDELGPYTVVQDWLKPLPGHDGWTLGGVEGVFADTPNRIFVLQVGEVPVPRQPNAKARTDWLVFTVDRNGQLLEGWTRWDSVLVHPHKATANPYDPERHVWIVDDGAHQVFKFTNDGKRLVLALGERQVTGTDARHFNRPSDIAFLPDGTFFISDGYVNTRVMKFDKAGKFLMQWGSPGTGPGQFNLVHCVAVDAGRRVYVADRNNRRVQIFDENGKFIEQWPDLRSPAHLMITHDQSVWLSDGQNNRLLKYDLHGKLLTYWGTQGPLPIGFSNPHHYSVDSEGNLYIADYGHNTVKKLVPKSGADRDRLIGQPFGAHRTN